MQKNNRKEFTNGVTPLISIDEVAAEKESFKLSWTVLANIREYVAYVNDVTGRETTSDAVVDKGLQRLFDADKGFRQWLQKKNGGHKNKGKQGKAEKVEKPAFDGKVETANAASPKTSS
ncbi:MAG TPA: hypothetical protein VGB07_18665 [Blastocatellia bacterium]